MRMLLMLSPLWLAGCQASPAGPHWQPWGPELFARATDERRLVLLEVGTGWCHWCHVMEETTWADPEVGAEIERHFVVSKVDADARLDLATRYQDWGWPATIVFDAAGRELWKQRGYLAPGPMLQTLQRLAADPTPLAAVVAAPSEAGGRGLTEATRAELLDRLEALHDEEHGGFGRVHKYLDADGAEWLLSAARRGDRLAAERLREWLVLERRLHDPVDGGVYQYSHGGVWEHPHYERIMSRQVADLRSYALAAAAFGDDADLQTARGVAGYLRSVLLAPDGAFWASQDADRVAGTHAADWFALDAAGRAGLPAPRIDTSVYARENGWAIGGLCTLHAVSGERQPLALAVAAGERMLATRRLPDGGFAHGDRDVGGPFLADQLAMGMALLQLFECTQEPRWLRAATEVANAIERHFSPTRRGDGYKTAVGDGVLAPVADRTENIALLRFALRLHHVSGAAVAQRILDHSRAQVFAEAVARQPGLPADVLLADVESRTDPEHVVVVGRRDDPAAAELFAVALRESGCWRRLEWVAPGEPGVRGDVHLPSVEQATAFACSQGVCSAPIEAADELRSLLRGGARSPTSATATAR
ncbi:MAG: thioredoxin domain-containing protein [Planctomycetes bacterium]|nr:thioredoxin domain-containing protein [Planctomycetota bacterium]